MKKNLKNVFIVFLLSTAIIACSSDDDSGNGLAGIPSGEIVAVELRDQALTGFTDEEGTQRWWTHIISSINFSSEECGDNEEYESLGFYAFYPSGDYYQKSDMSGSKIRVGSWEWEDNSKSKMFVTNQNGSGVMTVTYLNDDNVVFGQTQSGEGCSVTSYERFNNPVN